MGKKKEKKEKDKNKPGGKMSWAELTGPARDIVEIPKDWNKLQSDDDDDVEYVTIDRTNLPKAPKGAQEISLDSIPKFPPFQLYMLGIPFTATEDKVIKFFEDCKVSRVNMGTEGGRNRGNAVIEFEDRASLINALKKDDSTMGNRQIHVSLDNPRERSTMNRMGDFSRGAGLSSGSTMASLPDDWRSTLRKKSDALPTSQNFSNTASPFQSFNRFNKQNDRNAPYKGRFSDDNTHSARSNMFGNSWNSNLSSGFLRNNSYDSRTQSTNINEAKPFTSVASSTANAVPLLSAQELRKVDTGALKALLTDDNPNVPVITARSKSIFGDAKPVDTSSKINEAMQKLNHIQIQDSKKIDPDNRRPSTPQLDRPSYRSSRSEDFRAGRNQTGSSMSAYPFQNNQKDLPPRYGNLQHKPPPSFDSRKLSSSRNTVQPRYTRHKNEVSNEFPAEDNAEFGKADWPASDVKHFNYLSKDTYTLPLSKNRFSCLKAEEADDDQST
ncbi:hypothetical protein GJ496_002852 [Pomphorhynchus laevis]|nr:hypothetical protein GJ496_002852 [Pomphorhynchus laevis]